MKQKHITFLRFDTVIFIVAVIVLVFSFMIAPRKKVVFKKSTIVFLQWWEAGMDDGSLDKLIREFEHENPAINVKMAELSKNDTLRYLRDGTFAEQPLYDIVALDPYWIPELIQKNYLHKLEPALFYAHTTEETASGMPVDSLYKTFTGAEGLYAIPVVTFGNYLFYNIPLLRDAGFDRPPKTREDFIDICKNLVDGGGGYGYAISDDVWVDCFPWVWQAGVGISRVDGGFPAEAFFKDRTVRQSLAFLNGLNRGKLLYPYPFEFNAAEKIKAFSEGRAAMVCAPISAVRQIRALNAGLDFNVTTIPPPRNYSGRPVLNVTGWFAGVPAAGQQIDSAVIFLEFLNAKKSELAQASGALAVNTGTPAEQDGIYQKAQNLFNGAEIIEDYFLFSDIVQTGAALMDEVRKE